MGEVILSQPRENYRSSRKEVKKELRKRTLRKIRKQGGTICKLFWTDLRGKRTDEKNER